MPRSRRFLGLCALVVLLSWSNVQAMTCCWAWSTANPTSKDGSEQAAAGEADVPNDNAGAAMSCHAPAAAHADQDAADIADASPETTQGPRDANASSASPHSFSSVTTSTILTMPAAAPANQVPAVAACCEAPPPAETFSAVPHFDAPPQRPAEDETSDAWISATAAQAATHFVATDGPPAHLSSSRFLALERLLI